MGVPRGDNRRIGSEEGVPPTHEEDAADDDEPPKPCLLEFTHEKGTLVEGRGTLGVR